MLVIWFVGAVVATIIGGVYCEVNNVNTANIAPKIFLRSLLWPLFVLNGIVWGIGMALAVVYGHCIATAVRERFKR